MNDERQRQQARWVAEDHVRYCEHDDAGGGSPEKRSFSFLEFYIPSNRR
jgi:hypothetical protein